MKTNPLKPLIDNSGNLIHMDVVKSEIEIIEYALQIFTNVIAMEIHKRNYANVNNDQKLRHHKLKRRDGRGKGVGNAAYRTQR